MESLPRGYFRQPGIMHLHVDGGPQIYPVRRVLALYDGKLQRILKAAAGPQRRELPDVYLGHTPGSVEKEDFEFFSTMPIASRDHAIHTVLDILPRLASYPNIVVELERVVLSGNGASSLVQWEEAPFDAVQRLTAAEVPYAQPSTLPIELHHGINIRKNESRMPVLSVDTLLDASRRMDMRVGGWFLFEKEDAWAYRSNEFTTTDCYTTVAKQQNDKLHGYLGKLSLPYELWTIAEQVVGLWRT